MKSNPLHFASILVSALSLMSANVLAQGLDKAWETAAELKGPESAVFDAARNTIYVSNVNGPGTEVDGNGFISRIARDGRIEELEWVSGLDGPKGMALYGTKLYVSDITDLVEIDVISGSITQRYVAEGAIFLNDVAVDDNGTVYVSDMVTNTIHKLADGEFSTWLQSEALESPNGLHIQGDKMIVGSWGKMTDGFATEVPGHLKTISIADMTIESLGDGTPVGNLDGVEPDGKGNYLVTDWMNGKLFRIEPSGSATEILALEQGSADIGMLADEGLILIPMMMNGKLVAYKAD